MKCKNLLVVGLAGLVAFVLAGCDGPTVSYDAQKKKGEDLEAQAKKAPGYDPSRQ